MKFSKKAKTYGKVWETWTTESGEAITVDKMSEQHAMNLLLKRNKRLQVKIETLKGMSKEFRDIMNHDHDWDDKNWM